MTRVIHISLDQNEVLDRCNAAKVGISAVESLPSGGTRLVCMSADGAAKMRKKLKSQLIAGPVTRRPYRPGTPPL
jgi:hypothetical protein